MEKQKVTLQTVDRALELIDLMSKAGRGMSIQEISKALDVTRTGAYNLLNSLMEKNYVEKNPETNKYGIGYRLLELGYTYLYQNPFVPVIISGIEKIGKKWPDPINLCVYKSPCKSVLLWRKGGEFNQVGKMHVTVPAYMVSEGKLLLAYLPEDQLEAELERVELRPYARGTITDKDQLREELKTIRQQGYAVDWEEARNNLASIACPIFNISGQVVAAVGIKMTSLRMREKQEKCLEDLLTNCQYISMDLGYNPYAK